MYVFFDDIYPFPVYEGARDGRSTLVPLFGRGCAMTREEVEEEEEEAFVKAQKGNAEGNGNEGGRRY